MNNLTTNEKGSTSLSTSGNARVDLFFKTVRDIEVDHLERLLEASWKEDPLDTLKIAFYNRDCRGGKGERKIFRHSIHWIIKNHPQHFLENIELVSEFGRWEDLLWFMTKPNDKQEDTTTLEAKTLQVDDVTNTVAKLFAEQLIKDEKTMLEGKPVSICAKWAPSENLKHDKLSRAPKVICNAMNINYAVYRKKYLVPLRAYIKVVECYMCAKKWDQIDYSKVPSRAMNKLKKAFEKNDKRRFLEFKNKLRRGETKVNSTQVEPHDLVRQYMGMTFNERTEQLEGAKEDIIVEEQWKGIVERVKQYGSLKDSIVLADVSGSMNGTPMEVSIALGILISTLAREPFKGQIITFHEQPDFHTLEGDTLCEQVKNIMSNMKWGGTTDFQAIFNLILDRAKNAGTGPDEMPKQLFVISDMQFDEADTGGEFKTHYQILQEKFSQAGYEMPKIVFWNVRASTSEDVTNNATDQGVAMISGFSPSILKTVLTGKQYTPYTVLRQAIDNERYSKIKLAKDE
jgi:hypothetical protein